MTHPPFAFSLPATLVTSAVNQALAEDLGLAGDITTEATVPAHAHASAALVARRAGVVAGLEVAEAAFRRLDSKVQFHAEVHDGAMVGANTVIANVSGNARALLTAERVALNFLGRMSGIASLTRAYVERIAGTKAQIVDTRKTTPGLRAFEKYAVRCGGGGNHRVGLFDAVLIKDNHVIASGGLAQAIEAARCRVGHMVKIEAEVDTIEQLREAVRHKIDAVLLDNMTVVELREAVEIVSGRLIVEASGGINLETVRAVAETGVDLISVGALTHSAPVLDLALDFSPAAGGVEGDH